MVGTACGPAIVPRFVQTYPFFAVRKLEFEVSNANRTSSWFVFGAQPASIALPPTGCLLRTDIAIPVWVTVDPGGGASLSLDVTRAPAGASAYVQFVQATWRGSQMDWNTSEAVRVQL